MDGSSDQYHRENTPNSNMKLPYLKTRSSQAIITPYAQRLSAFSSFNGRTKSGSDSIAHLSNAIQAADQMRSSVEALCNVALTLVGSAYSNGNQQTMLYQMQEACNETTAAAQSLCCAMETTQNTAQDHSVERRQQIAGASRSMLFGMCRILAIADDVRVLAVVATQDNILRCLQQLENVTNFQDFVHFFGEFGNSMVDLARHSGERQSDLVNEWYSARLSCSRALLEKGTMMLLTSSKTLLRHPECNSAQQNRDAVFDMIRSALASSIEAVRADSLVLDDTQTSICHSLLAMKTTVEDCCAASGGIIQQPVVEELLKRVADIKTQVQQSFTSHSTHLDIPAQELTHISTAIDQIQVHLSTVNPSAAVQPHQALASTLTSLIVDLMKSMQSTVLDQCSALLSSSADTYHMRVFKDGATSGNIHLVENEAANFSFLSNQYQDLCQLLFHVALTPELRVTAQHCSTCVLTFSRQVVLSAQTAALYPSSKIASENLSVFIESWNQLMQELSVLMRDVSDVTPSALASRRIPANIGSVGSAVVKCGQDIKLSASQLETELNQLSVSGDQNIPPKHADIIKRGRNLCSMAFALYQYSIQQGPLKSTSDLFTQVQFLLQEAGKIMLVLSSGDSQVISSQPAGGLKAVLERMPEDIKHLQYVCSPGFNQSVNAKVEMCLDEVRSLMQHLRLLLSSFFQPLHSNLVTGVQNLNIGSQQSESDWPNAATNHSFTQPPAASIPPPLSAPSEKKPTQLLFDRM